MNFERAALQLAVDVRPHCLPNSTFKASDALLNSLRDKQNCKHKRDGARDGEGHTVCEKHGVRHHRPPTLLLFRLVTELGRRRFVGDLKVRIAVSLHG